MSLTTMQVLRELKARDVTDRLLTLPINPFDGMRELHPNDDLFGEAVEVMGLESAENIRRYLTNPQYGRRELKMIREIMTENQDMIDAMQKPSKKVWMTSAGGPGSGKSTLLLRAAVDGFDIPTDKTDWDEVTLRGVSQKLEDSGKAVFISPDRSALLQIADKTGAKEITPEFYVKWRAASNAITLMKIASALAAGVSIVHDTTLSSDSAINNIKYALNDAGYDQADIFIVASTDDTSEQAVANRIERGYFQSLPANIQVQREGFNNNIPNLLDLLGTGKVLLRGYWREKADRDAIHVFSTDGRTRVHNAYAATSMADMLPNLRAPLTNPNWRPTLSP